MPRYDDVWIADMLSPRRAALAAPAALLRAAGVEHGCVVADVGCGPGFLTLPAARLVGAAGRVYAIDVEPRMLAYVAARAAAEGLSTVTTVAATGPAVALPDAGADAVLCALVLHDLPPYERTALAGDLARVCRPGGHVLVVEWQPEPAESRSNRLAPAAVVDLLGGAGLRADLPQLLDGGDEAGYDAMYYVVARRPV